SGLEVPIVRVVGPALVDGETGLPRAPGLLRGDELLRRVEVTRARQAIVHQRTGLDRADHVAQLPAPPLLGGPLPAAVEPEEVDRPVVGPDLADLAAHAREGA